MLRCQRFDGAKARGDDPKSKTLMNATGRGCSMVVDAFPFVVLAAQDMAAGIGFSASCRTQSPRYRSASDRVATAGFGVEGVPCLARGRGMAPRLKHIPSPMSSMLGRRANGIYTFGSGSRYSHVTRPSPSSQDVTSRRCPAQALLAQCRRPDILARFPQRGAAIDVEKLGTHTGHQPRTVDVGPDADKYTHRALHDGCVSVIEYGSCPFLFAVP